MNASTHRTHASRGRIGARRDLVVLLVGLAAFLIGLSTGLFAWIHGLADSDAAVGFLLVGGPVAILLILFRRQEADREATLRIETEARFQAMVEQVPAAAYTWEVSPSPEAVPLLYISPQLGSMLGYGPDDWQRDPSWWEKQVHPDDLDAVLVRWRDAAAKREAFVAEYRFRAADGREIWVRDEAAPVTGGPGGSYVYQGVMHDVTARRRAEEALGQAEERYRSLVEQVPAAVYIDAADDVVTARYISPQYEHLTGYTPEQRVQDPELWSRMLHDEDRARVLAESRRTNGTGEPFDMEYRIVRADGEVRWLRDQALLIHGTDGHDAWQGVLSDITDNKRAEEALRRRDRILEGAGYAAERLLRSSTWTECIGDVLRVLGERGNAVRVALYENVDVDGVPGVAQREAWLAEHAPEPLRHLPPSPWPYGDAFERWRQVLDAGGVIGGAVEDLPDAERAVMTELGIEALIAMPVHAEGVCWGFIGFDRCDRTPAWQPAEVDAIRVAANTLGAAIERERAVARLGRTEARYRTLIETIPAVTYVAPVDGGSGLAYMSPQIEQVLGYTASAWTADPTLWERGLHPDDRERIVAQHEALRRTGEPFHAEYRFVRPDGRVVWISDHAAVLAGEGDGPPVAQGVFFDITAHREAEQHLREAEERYRNIVEHVPAAIYMDVADSSMRSVYMSPQIERIAGITAEEWIASPDAWLTLVPAEDRDEVRADYMAALEAGAPWSADYRMQTRDGRMIWVHDETTILRDTAGNPTYLQGVLMDVTERKLAEQALRDSERREREAAQRLRDLDEMKNTFLAAVSHELRSPLTSILGLAITLDRASEMDDADRQDLLGRLSANARKLDRLLKDLLDIDRLNRGIVAPQYRRVDVGSLTRSTVESMDSIVDRSVIVDAGEVVLSVDPPKVERIVENLVMNAVRHTVPDRTIWVKVQPHDGGVLLIVEDDGPGVPSTQRQAIFEPFTQGATAPAHQPGTGIGLSLVSRFAELHGGTAWVEERPEGGASFRVQLPDGPAVTGAEAAVEPASAWGSASGR